LRDYTPIPLIVLLLFLSYPTIWSATLGLILIVAGELLRIYSVSFIGSISRTRKERTGGKLITEGPFGYVRNPLYVGNFFICLGFAVYGSSWIVIALTVLLFAIQYFFIVKYEENLLAKVFGPEYDEYRRTVPAWFPMRMPRIEEIDNPPALGKALKSEKKTLMSITLLIALLVVTA
jgi:protein-S-isoprenylcysteine O-methyltransferase Ste14